MNPSPSDAAGFDRDYADEQLRRSHHPLRRTIKGFYLRNVLQDVIGPTIDYGCGAGQLLARLPAGSIGLEVNPHLVDALGRAGLSLRQWQATDAGFDLTGLDGGGYRTLVISHVLEHLDDPAAALARLTRACERIGVQRLIAIVPGAKGYASDATHRTFIDPAYLRSHGLARIGPYRLARLSHFPLPFEGGGRQFIYNEMKMVFDREGADR